MLPIGSLVLQANISPSHLTYELLPVRALPYFFGFSQVLNIQPGDDLPKSVCEGCQQALDNTFANARKIYCLQLILKKKFSSSNSNGFPQPPSEAKIKVENTVRLPDTPAFADPNDHLSSPPTKQPRLELNASPTKLLPFPKLARPQTLDLAMPNIFANSDDRIDSDSDSKMLKLPKHPSGDLLSTPDMPALPGLDSVFPSVVSPTAVSHNAAGDHLDLAASAAVVNAPPPPRPTPQIFSAPIMSTTVGGNSNMPPTIHLPETKGDIKIGTGGLSLERIISETVLSPTSALLSEQSLDQQIRASMSSHQGLNLQQQQQQQHQSTVTSTAVSQQALTAAQQQQQQLAATVSASPQLARVLLQQHQQQQQQQQQQQEPQQPAPPSYHPDAAAITSVSIPTSINLSTSINIPARLTANVTLPDGSMIQVPIVNGNKLPSIHIVQPQQQQQQHQRPEEALALQQQHRQQEQAPQRPPQPQPPPPPPYPTSRPISSSVIAPPPPAYPPRPHSMPTTATAAIAAAAQVVAVDHQQEAAAAPPIPAPISVVLDCQAGNFRCSACDVRFGLDRDTASSIERHCSAAHNAGAGSPTRVLYLCGACGKAFPNAGMVADHVRAVHAAPPQQQQQQQQQQNHVCPVCGESFAEKGPLKQHFQANHLPPKGTPVPQVSTPSLPPLPTPNAITPTTIQSPSKNTPGVRHECATCGKTFASKPTLRRHQQIHLASPKKEQAQQQGSQQQQQEYLCAKCGKGFKNKGGFTVHSIVCGKNNNNVKNTNNAIASEGPAGQSRSDDITVKAEPIV